MRCHSSVEFGKVFSTISVKPSVPGGILHLQYAGLKIEGVLAYFTQLKCQKCIGDDVGDSKYVLPKNKFFVCENDPPDTFYPPYYARIYDSKCLKMYLITLKVFKIC
jgi:hypothetical protein